MRRNGVDVTFQTVLPADQAAPGLAPTLVVNAEVSACHIQVTRSPAPVPGPTSAVPTPDPVTATAG